MLEISRFQMESNRPTTGISETLEEPVPNTSETSNVKVMLRKPATEEQNSNVKKVKFTDVTVDNENMNKKKSKCCCIYEKQKLFGESSSEDEGNDDCLDHCHGSKRHHNKQNKPVNDNNDQEPGSK